MLRLIKLKDYKQHIAIYKKNGLNYSHLLPIGKNL